MTPDEVQILARARQGDRAALLDLFRPYSQAILTHAEFKIEARWKAHLTPDDVLQTTYIDAVKNLGSFEPRGENSFLPWLKRIAEHNIIDTIRGLEAQQRATAKSKGTRFGRPVDVSVSLLQSLVAADGQTTPSRTTAVEDAKATLRWALDQLQPEHRRVVEWYDIEGRSMAAIAAEFGKTQGATYMMRTRAHERLREVLARKAGAFFTNP